MIIKLQTERLILRSIQKSDAKEIFSYRSDAETNKYQGWIPKTIDDVNDFIENRVASEIDIPDSWYQFSIIIKENEKLIGDLGIHFLTDDNQQVEIGCTINKKYHKQRFASEALTKIIDYIFNDLNKHRIVTSIDPQNIGSIALVSKLGFRKEAHFKKSILINGKWVDDLVFAILKEEWIAKD